MYHVIKTMEVAGCHHLTLPYPSKCTKPHGHNWTITVYCKAKELNENGMVIDFKEIKEIVHDYLDHGDLNELLPFNPTAENLAKWVCDNVPHCWKVEVVESKHNVVVYEKDED